MDGGSLSEIILKDANLYTNPALTKVDEATRIEWARLEIAAAFARSPLVVLATVTEPESVVEGTSVIAVRVDDVLKGLREPRDASCREFPEAVACRLTSPEFPEQWIFTRSAILPLESLQARPPSRTEGSVYKRWYAAPKGP